MDRSTEADIFPGKECRLILIGKTGAGKSATGNTILGYEAFKAQIGVNSVTKQCGRKSAVKDGLTVTVMDTPGLSDSDGEDSQIVKLITKSLLTVSQGLHAVVLVLRCDSRFTDEEVKVYNALKDIFGQKMTDYMIVIFVGADHLPSISSFEEQQLPKAVKLQPIIKEAHNRYVLFNNKAEGRALDQQVDKLLATVKDIARENNCQCFKFRNADKIEQDKEQMVIEEIENISGKKLSVKQEKPQAKPAVEAGKEESESAPVHRKEVEDLEKLQSVTSTRAMFEQRASGGPLRQNWKRDTGTVPPSPGKEEPPAQWSTTDTMPEGSKSLAGMLEELALRETMLDQLRESCKNRGEAFNSSYAAGRTDLQLAEDLFLDKVLNQEDDLTPGQKQLLNKSETVVDVEVKKGMRKNSIKDSRVLAKCSLM